MMNRTVPFALAPLVLTALVLPTQAQVAANPHGFVLSGGLVGAGLTVKDAGAINWYGGETSSAPGGHLAIGYAFPNGLSIHLGGSATGPYTDRDGDDYIAAVGEFTARYLLGATGSTVRPFLDLGLGVLGLDYDPADLELSGWHFSAGGGVAYFVRPSLVLDAALRAGMGSISEVKMDRITVELEEADRPRATMIQYAVGLRWYPMARAVLARHP
jgi:hypothetical protein